MTTNEIILQLTELRDEITEMGQKHLHDSYPFKLNEVGELLIPFTELEKAFDKQIKKLQNQICVEKAEQSMAQINSVFKGLDPLIFKK